jgi:thiamine pyrophosphate-dependent acetolactate synthase large subunit-like protein
MNKIKGVLTICILVGTCSFPTQAQSILDDLEWFEYFFQSNSIDNVDNSLANTQAKIMDAQETFDKPAEAMAMKDKLVFIDVYVDRNEHVYPMQIAGQAMRDMWLTKGERT